ncbi:MAG: MotA/TolQ/ExbB proton channel family protein [Phycisphaerales bacterium]|nr:MAG: MotA/TolQ/ExbB proton channel family protein [Phycisphaerales bacterium]
MLTRSSRLAGPGASENAAHELLERARPAFERFAPTLSTIITAAPMLGILGTVVGIIASFRLLGGSGPIDDPTAVAGGIATALYTTAFGLVIALGTLFPYAIFRARADRLIGRLETIAALVIEHDDQTGQGEASGVGAGGPERSGGVAQPTVS